LKKKHAVSDNEIINLSEDKLGLQQQVTELERDVEDLSRSKDELRRDYLQQGAQYVEIVKKATKLEKITGEERRAWNRLKADMDKSFDRLEGERLVPDTISDSMVHPKVSGGMAAGQVVVEDIDTAMPLPSTDPPPELKIESPIEARPPDSTLYQPEVRQESVEGLRNEICRLKARCSEIEGVLKAVFEDGRSVEGLIKSLLGRTSSTLADQIIGNA